LNQAADAFNKKDLEGVIQTALPEATMIRLDGTSLTISQWKELAQKDIAEMDTLRVEFKVESAEAEGQTAKATYTETDEYTLLKEKDHKYREVSRWTVSLVKTPQGWRCKHFEQLSRAGTRDGQPHSGLTGPKN
jgi:ketosteroid isomerase-like protein